MSPLAFRTLAAGTARAILCTRLVLLLVAVIALLIPLGAALTLFAMGAKGLLLREMGLATLLLGGLLVVLLADDYQPGEELRAGIGRAILAAPVSPATYVCGRLAGLGLALVAVTAPWLVVLAWTLSAHGAAPLDGPMLAAAGLGLVELLLIAAVLQRVSLALPAAPTLACGVGLYLAGHLAGELAALGPVARLLPNLAGMDLIGAAAAGELPAPGLPALLAVALAHAALYVAAFVYWTGSVLAVRGATVR